MRWLLLGLAYAAVVLAMHPVFWWQGRFLGWDAVREHWGDRVFPALALADAELPLWNPFEKGGYDFLGDPQTGVLYPLNWVAWLGIPILGTGPWIVMFSSVMHFVVAALGMHRILQREALPPWVRAFGGVAIMLCARFAKSKDSAALWPAIWIPWLYLTMRDALERPSWRTGGKLGVVTAMALLAGHPPTAVRGILTVAPLGVLLIVSGARAAPAAGRFLARVGGSVGTGLAVTLGLTLPMLLAAGGWMSLSVRQDMGLGEVLRSSITGWESVHLFAPHLLEINDLSMQYVGGAVFMLAVFAVLRRPSPEHIVLALSAAFVFVLACGGNTPILPFLVRNVPTFKLWRISEGYLFGVSFVIILLAARGLGALTETVDDPAGRRIRTRRLAAAVGLTWLAWGAAVPFAADWAMVFNTGLFLAVATACLMVFLGPPTARRLAVPLFFVALLADYGYQQRGIFAISQPAPNLQKDPRLLELKGVRDAYRVADDEFFQFRPGTRLEVRDLFGRYSTFVSRRYDAYQKKARTSAPLLRAANVKWVAGGAAGKLRKTLKGKEALIARGPGVWELPRAIARAMWYPKASVVATENESLAAVAQGRSPVLERASLPPETRKAIEALKGAQAPVPARLLTAERNVLRFEVSAPAPGVVGVAEAWAPGWQATVDAAPAEVFPLDHLFRGVFVPAGKHVVEMVYAPRGVRPAFALWAMCWLGVLAAVATARRRSSSPRA